MKRLSLSAGMLAAAQVGGQVIGLAMLVVVSRRIGPGYLGAYAFSYNIVGYVGLATTIGLPILGMREVSESPLDRRTVLLETLIARVALALVLGGALLATSHLVAPSAASRALLPILASKLLIDAVTVNWYLQGTGRNTSVAAAQFVSQIAYAAVLLPLLASGLAGARNYTVANIAGFGVAALIMGVLALRDLGPSLHKIKITFHGIRVRINRSGPFLWWVALTQIYYSTDLILVGYLGGDREAGLYAAASKLPLSVIGVGALWFGVSMPATARLIANTQIAVVREQTRAAATAALVSGVPFVLLGPIFATDIATTIFGRSFAGAGPALAILSASVAVSLLQIVVTSVVMGAGRERPYVRAMAVGAATNVALNVALIPTVGIIGAAIATLVAESVVLAAGLAQLRHVLGRLRVRWTAVRDAAMVTIGAGAVAVIVRQEAGFAAAAAAAALTYVAAFGVCTARNPRWLVSWLTGP